MAQLVFVPPLRRAASALRRRSLTQPLHPCFPRRVQHIALVNKRLHGLCLAPQLLESLDVGIGGEDGAAVVDRVRSLLGLFMAHGRHVRTLDLHVQLPEAASEQQKLEVAALVTGCLTACGTAAAGALEELKISPETPLASTAWLQGLAHLEEIGGLGAFGWRAAQALPLLAPAAAGPRRCWPADMLHRPGHLSACCFATTQPMPTPQMTCRRRGC